MPSPALFARAANDVALDLVDLDQAVAALERLLDVALQRRQLPVAQQARVRGQIGARAAAEQPIERQSRELARDVPERDVDRRQAIGHRAVTARAVQRARELGHERRDRGRIAADEDRRDDVVDRCARRAPDAMAESFAPAGDAFVSVDAHEQHLERRARLPADVRHVAVELERHVDDVRGDLGDFHRRRRDDVACHRSSRWLQRRVVFGLIVHSNETRCDHG